MASEIIDLELSQNLKELGIVEDFFFEAGTTQNFILDLNIDNKDVRIIFHYYKDWNRTKRNAKDAIRDKDIQKPYIKPILDTLDANYNSVAGTQENYNRDDVQEESSRENKDDDETAKSKRQFVIYKYSEMGKGSLHEAIIVNGLPFFIKYYNNKNKFELVENIEENNRTLRPPQGEEESPYTPYSFESNEELEFYIQKARQISLEGIYFKGKSLFSKYVDHDEYVIILLTADAIWTWFQDLFSTTHYTEGVGTNDVGKSSIGYTFEYTAYRVVKGVAISGANYNRILGSIEPGQCVIIEDEGDSISEDIDKVKLLKAGYEYNAKIPKINMNTKDQDQKWYRPYCYKMILAERSLKEYKVRGLVDRTFSFNCRPGKVKYQIKEVVSENIKKSPRLQKLYNELLSFRKLMLCYRLVHYKDELPEIETGLENRDNELSKPLLQLFYGTEALKNEIIPTLEKFVKQRRTRRANSLEAALYPIIKKHVFSTERLNCENNSYSELKVKKKSIKVPFSYIWNSIKDDKAIDGEYDAKKNKYEYVTVEYGTLYLNSLPTFIHDKFTAELKKEDYGRALIFDIEKLERFENLYGDIQLDDKNVKIDVRLKTSETDDFDDFDDFPGARIDISEKKDSIEHTAEKQTEEKVVEVLPTRSFDPIDNSNTDNSTSQEKNYSIIDRHALQKSSESSESSVNINERQSLSLNAEDRRYENQSPTTIIEGSKRMSLRQKIEAGLFTNPLISESDLLIDEDYDYYPEIINNITKNKGSDRWFCTIKDCKWKQDKWFMMKHPCKKCEEK
jgi:hypothetical protein